MGVPRSGGHCSKRIEIAIGQDARLPQHAFTVFIETPRFRSTAGVEMGVRRTRGVFGQQRAGKREIDRAEIRCSADRLPRLTRLFTVIDRVVDLRTLQPRSRNKGSGPLRKSGSHEYRHWNSRDRAQAAARIHRLWQGTSRARGPVKDRRYKTVWRRMGSASPPAVAPSA